MSPQPGQLHPARPDYALLALTAILTITGLVAVYSASFVQALVDFGNPEHFLIRQSIWAVLGAVLCALAIRTPFWQLQRWAVVIMLVTLVMLVLVLVLGTTVNGAKRWIGFGPFTVQPAEFAKLAVIIYIAAWLASRGETIRSWGQGFLPFVIIIAGVAVLIMLQPSLGTTLIICCVTGVMFWVAGATWSQTLVLITAGVLAAGVLATVEGYRADRLTAFFDAESDPAGHGFQTLQAVVAMGNGGWSGLGLGASRGKFFYIPESHTDGVFAIIGEELGLIATVAIVFLFMILMFRGFQIARRAPTDFATLVATGITTWISVQMLLNVGGITRTIPLTGVPLPFLSSGGSALAAVMLAMGVLINISRYQQARAQGPATEEADRRSRGRKPAPAPRRGFMTFPRRPW
jgi:cell division protein FtsW